MAIYERKGAAIKDLRSGEIKDHKFINAAKRESRSLQVAADGALGRGSLKVVRKFSK